MGANDPLALVRTLPSVATGNDLQASFPVRGGATADNLFEADGARVMNPIHMLGLFSAFNPSYYRSYIFRPGRMPSTVPSLTSALFSADSGLEPDTCFSGSATVGLIESHGALRAPIVKNRLSLSVGYRRSYLDAVFPTLLSLGTSTLRYRFTDFNAAVNARVSDKDILRLSFFGNRDRLGLENHHNGSKEGAMGWSNVATAATWRHRDIETVVSYTGLSNTFQLEEGGAQIDQPTYLRRFAARTLIPLGRLTADADIAHCLVSGQNGFGRASSWELNIAADWEQPLSNRLTLTAGLRLAAYVNGSFTAWRPQPRLCFGFDLGHGYAAWLAAGRRVRFDKTVEESTSGLPTDFYICADAAARPHDVWSAELGFSGAVPHTGITFSAEAYYKLIRHEGEFAGSIVDLASPDYNPLADYLDGRGYAAGISLALMRQVGKVRGRLGYNLGMSRARFDRFGDDYMPSAHDRPHDLNLSLNWSVLPPFTVSASFTYASGTPYTRAKYGYMIGENLICEYFPHNSSRLPAYRRLDLSASWVFRSRACSHTVNISVYNALASHNVLFRYTSYTLDKGIQQRESVMKAVIPSVAYTITF